MKKQQGAALLVSLIFLLVLTIIGVASMNDTIMQGKMAGAMQDSNIALQGADTAIRDAEDYIESLATIGGFGVEDGLYLEGQIDDENGDRLSFYSADTWTDDYTRTANAVDGLKEQPRYLIELTGEIKEEDTATSLNVDTYSHETGSGTLQGFRIVARSTGASGNSQRIVESFYGKRF